jgi:hypothetical protein
MEEEEEPAGRRFDLQEQPPQLSAEDHIAALPEGSEQEVYLKRGVTPTQRMHMQKSVIRASFIGLRHMLQPPDEQAARPEPEHVHGYVSQHRNDEVARLIEFSTDPQMALKYASEGRYGYVLTIRIKRKHLVKGATGSEHGWIATQGAPYDIVAIERWDGMPSRLSLLTEQELRDAVRHEELAEFLLSVQDPAAMAAHVSQFSDIEERKAEAMRILDLRRSFYAD